MKASSRIEESSRGENSLQDPFHGPYSEVPFKSRTRCTCSLTACRLLFDPTCRDDALLYQRSLVAGCCHSCTLLDRPDPCRSYALVSCRSARVKKRCVRSQVARGIHCRTSVNSIFLDSVHSLLDGSFMYDMTSLSFKISSVCSWCVQLKCYVDRV